MFVHMSHMIPAKDEICSTWKCHPGHDKVQPSMIVNKIFFSKNEKFIVLITEN